MFVATGQRGFCTGTVTPWREVLPLHSAAADGCLLVGARFRNFISRVWVHWMRPFPPLQQETSYWVPPFQRRSSQSLSPATQKNVASGKSSSSGVIRVAQYEKEKKNRLQRVWKLFSGTFSEARLAAYSSCSRQYTLKATYPCAQTTLINQLRGLQ